MQVCDQPRTGPVCNQDSVTEFGLNQSYVDSRCLVTHVRISPGATSTAYISTMAIMVVVTVLPAVCAPRRADREPCSRRIRRDRYSAATSRTLQWASTASGTTIAVTKYAHT